MRRNVIMRHVMVVLLVMVLLVITMPSQAQQEDSAVLYETEFNSGQLPEEFLSAFVDAWQVTEVTRDNETLNVLRGTKEPDFNESFFIAGGENWTDYIVEMRVWVDSPLFLSFYTRTFINGGEFDVCEGSYAFVFGPEFSEIHALGQLQGCEYHIRDTQGVVFPTNRWVDVRLEVFGDQQIGYLDGEVAISSTDDFPLTGTVGLALFSSDAASGGIVDIASIRVTEYSETAVVADDPEPTDDSPPTGDLAEPAADAVLADYAEEPAEAIAELVAMDFVPEDAEPFFEATQVYSFSGSGTYYTPVFRTETQRVVLASEMSFQGGDGDSCSILARLVPGEDSRPEAALQFGLSGDGSAFWQERNTDRGDSSQLALEMSSTHHLLMIADAGTLSLFVDGAAIFEDVPLNTTGAGILGIEMQTDAGGQCQWRNVWAYEF